MCILCNLKNCRGVAIGTLKPKSLSNWHSTSPLHKSTILAGDHEQTKSSTGDGCSWNQRDKEHTFGFTKYTSQLEMKNSAVAGRNERRLYLHGGLSFKLKSFLVFQVLGLWMINQRHVSKRWHVPDDVTAGLYTGRLPAHRVKLVSLYASKRSSIPETWQLQKPDWLPWEESHSDFPCTRSPESTWHSTPSPTHQSCRSPGCSTSRGEEVWPRKRSCQRGGTSLSSFWENSLW